MTLVFDTETTGLVNFKLPAADPSQPRLVQLGAILYDADWKIRGELNLIVTPSGFSIPDEASRVHGITNEVANAHGVPAETALSAFRELSKRATVFVAHNFDYDIVVVSGEHIRLTDSVGVFDHLRDASFCTMKATTPICKIPGTRAGWVGEQHQEYKWPRLQEAYRFAFNEEFDGAHDAMADVRACARIYRWLKERKETNE